MERENRVAGVKGRLHVFGVVRKVIDTSIVMSFSPTALRGEPCTMPARGSLSGKGLPLERVAHQREGEPGLRRGGGEGGGIGVVWGRGGAKWYIKLRPVF